MKNLEYTTDPTKRCMYCKGREVRTYADGKLIDINLNFHNNLYFCKDKRECQRNLESENTIVLIHENGYKITKDFGKPIVEVEYTNGLEWGDEFDDGR